MIALVLVMVIESIGHSIYPPPADLDLNDLETLAAHIEKLPLGAFVFVLAAWALGAYGGGVVAGVIARARPFLMASIVGGLIMAGTIAQLVLIPHPLWFSVTGIIAIVVMTLLAGVTVKAFRGKSSES